MMEQRTVVIVVHGAGKVGQLSLVFAKIFDISSFLLLFKTLKELLRRRGASDGGRYKWLRHCSSCREINVGVV
jgi:hypothetical protein